MALLTPQTGSIINNPDGSNRTGTALSTNIVIRVGNNAVGAIQTISITEARDVEMIAEVGTDGFIDSAPRSATKVSGSCKRIRYDRLRMAEAFSRGFIHIKSQRIPFDIVVIDNYSASDDGSNALITTIKNVWITQVSYSYESGNFIIADDMQWQAEDIFSTVNNGNAANGGSRGIPLQINSIERETDRGGRRGALDAPGLLAAVFNT